jgi:hypothetical protein
VPFRSLFSGADGNAAPVRPFPREAA